MKRYNKKKTKETFINNEKFTTYYPWIHFGLVLICILMYFKCKGDEPFDKAEFTYIICCPYLYLPKLIACQMFYSCFGFKERNLQCEYGEDFYEEDDSSDYYE